MSTITNIPTSQLKLGDTLLIDASMVTVESVEVDYFDDDDVRWLRVSCVSGNPDQFETPLRVAATTEWRVLRDP